MNDELGAFTLIFREKVKLEQRAENLERAIDFYENRLERLEGRAVRPWINDRIDNVTSLLGDAQEELESINDSLTNYANVDAERDSFDISVSTRTLSNGRVYGEATVTVVDSLVDDTFEAGDGLIFRGKASGRPTPYGNSKFTSTARLTPVAESADNVFTFTYGSTTLGDQLTNYSSFEADLLNADGNFFHTQSIY